MRVATHQRNFSAFLYQSRAQMQQMGYATAWAEHHDINKIR
jgi:hypothetical protein